MSETTNIEWARDIVRQCKAAGVPAFVKQIGDNATNREGEPHPTIARAGADPPRVARGSAREGVPAMTTGDRRMSETTGDRRVCERPIIFSAPMVRAILDGRKTQTRRVAKIARIDAHPQDARVKIATMAGRGEQFWMNCQPEHPQHISRACPYGAPGDRLWVKEGCAIDEREGYRNAYYRAEFPDGAPAPQSKWRPSIHMPRWASRITLEIVSVRVERVQEISEEDALAEGALEFDGPTTFVDDGMQSIYFPNMGYARAAFIDLWDSINANRAPWESNPWVWAIEFRRIDA